MKRTNMGIDSMLISVSNNKVENEVRTAYLGFGSNVRVDFGHIVAIKWPDSLTYRAIQEV